MERDTHTQRERDKEGTGRGRRRQGKGLRKKGVPTFQNNPKALPAPIIRRQPAVVYHVVVHRQIKGVIVSTHTLGVAVMYPIVMPHLVLYKAVIIRCGQ